MCACVGTNVYVLVHLCVYAVACLRVCLCVSCVRGRFFVVGVFRCVLLRVLLSSR